MVYIRAPHDHIGNIYCYSGEDFCCEGETNNLGVLPLGFGDPLENFVENVGPRGFPKIKVHFWGSL